MVENNKLIFTLGLIILFLDQFTKQLVKSFSVNTSGHFVDITFTTNTGSLFSLFAGASLVNIIFIVLSLFAIGILIYLFNEEKIFLRKISYIIIVSGILGNFIDRIIYGKVIDFINFHFWPIFNLADSALFIGVIISLITLIKEKEPSNNSKR
ncbi:signal peptidase II [Candidatus Woesearchaeota archaeon]|nr:signal peptidase II [Candidatus Woesearchaeota archaeon]